VAVNPVISRFSSSYVTDYRTKSLSGHRLISHNTQQMISEKSHSSQMTTMALIAKPTINNIK